MSKQLTQNQVEEYTNNGYLLINNFFNSTTLKNSIQALQEILDAESKNNIEFELKDNSVIRRIREPTLLHSVFDDLCTDSMLLDAIEKLIGKNIIFRLSRINMKSPQIGSIVEWHQDFCFGLQTNTDLLTCMIYLDDADKENGCLQVIPGSHRNGLLDHEENGYFRGKVTDENLPINSTPVYLPASAGSLIFIHCLTLHKSDPNYSNQSRRALLASYKSADAFPIYMGSDVGLLQEPAAKLVRGNTSKFARTETGNWQLPIAETKFSSIYEIQEGSHLAKIDPTKSGYYGYLDAK